MPFNNLHNEIVEIIFYMHVYCHLESRYSLLLVCRKWHAIATNFTELWRRISWYKGKDRCMDAIKCRSFEALVRNVHRAGNATYDLTLGRVWDSTSSEEEDVILASLPSSWLSQCRSLRIWANPDDLFVHPGMMEPLFRGRSFDSLELLELVVKANEISSTRLHEFCSLIEASALRLQSLKIRDGGVARIVTQYPSIFSRIRMLVLGWDMPHLPWGQLTALEHLEITQVIGEDSEFGNLADIVAPRLTLLCLRGRYDRDHFPPNEIFKGLTHLMFDAFDPEDEGVLTSIPCPLLQHLGLRYHKLETLRWIDAPNVRELTIQCGDGPSYSRRSINPCIVPRVLRLDIFHGMEWETSFLTYLLPNWSQLEELHIRLFTFAGDLSPDLIKVMTTTSLDEQYFPKLVCLTVCFNYLAWKHHATAHKAEKISQLLDMMKERVDAGMPRFSILKFGWHWAGTNLPTLSDPSAEWWPTEWTDCLQYASH